MLEINDIKMAADRIASHIIETPILSLPKLNSKYKGHTIFFKAENYQHVGAFKARGAYNVVAWLKERGELPTEIVAYSSGNHAQAVAWVAKQFGINATVYMPEKVSQVKLEGTKKYGAKVKLFKERKDAESAAIGASKQGAYLIPPYDHDQIICGQGTACLEAISKQKTDAIFAPLGGGGLLSGTIIAAKGFDENIQVIGAEPLIANDAIRSLQQDGIYRWETAPNTIADGTRTLGISDRTKKYLMKADGFYEIDEIEIKYWTQYLNQEFEKPIEPTSSLGMAAAHHWLKNQDEPKNILIILSGGNMDDATKHELNKTNYLLEPPVILKNNKKMIIPNIDK